MVTEIPRLPLAYLCELRLELDACLSLLRDDPVAKEETRMRRPPTDVTVNPTYSRPRTHRCRWQRPSERNYCHW